MVRCWLEQIVNSVRVELSQAGIVIGGGGVCYQEHGLMLLEAMLKFGQVLVQVGLDGVKC